MAIRGRKPTPHLRLITGSHLKDRKVDAAVHGAVDEIPEGAAEKPDKLKGPQGKLWDRYIARCHWLTWADAPKALMWCHLQAEYEKKPTAMIASRIAQLRALGSELGLDPSSRQRIGTKGNGGEKKDPASKYLD